MLDVYSTSLHFRTFFGLITLKLYGLYTIFYFNFYCKSYESETSDTWFWINTYHFCKPSPCMTDLWDIRFSRIVSHGALLAWMHISIVMSFIKISLFHFDVSYASNCMYSSHVSLINLLFQYTLWIFMNNSTI